MSYNNRRPFSAIVSKNKHITSGATDFLITRAPWAAPVNKYFVLRKARVLNSEPTASGNSDVLLWDQDLSSTTPSKRGSAGGALFIIPGNATVGISGVHGVLAGQVGTNECPAIPFYAGITCRADINTTINLELELV